jgi:hypothetical protein
MRIAREPGSAGEAGLLTIWDEAEAREPERLSFHWSRMGPMDSLNPLKCTSCQ